MLPLMLSQRSNSSSICRLSKQQSNHYCASRTEPRPPSWWADRTMLLARDTAAPENSVHMLELSQRREQSDLSHPDTLHWPSTVVIALVMSLPSPRCSQAMSEVRVLAIFCIPHMCHQMLCLFKIWDLILCLWAFCEMQHLDQQTFSSGIPMKVII